MSVRASTFLVVAALGGAAALGCSTTAYTLKVDAEEPGKVELCTATADQGQTCSVYDAQALEAPARLNVEVTNSSDDETYQLRIEEQRIPAKSTDARRILGTVLERLVGFGGDLVKPLAPPKDQGGDPGGDEFDAKASFLAAAKTQVETLKPRLTSWFDTRADELLGSKPPPTKRQEPDVLFRHWLEDGKSTLKDHSVKEGEDADRLFGEFAAFPPPARVATLGEEDLRFLATKNVSPAELGKHVIAKCEPASFNDADGKEWEKNWERTIVELDIKDQDLLKALAPDRDALERTLRKGESPVNVTKRFNELRNGAGELLEDEKTVSRKVLSRDQEVVYFTARASFLGGLLERCATNLDFMAGKDSLNQAKYAETKRRIDALARVAKPARRRFQDSIQPFLVSVARDAISAASEGGRVVFGTRTIVPGKVRVNLAEGTGDSPRALADLTLEVKGYDGISVQMGALAAACYGCYKTVEEAVIPAEGATPTRRVLREESTDFRGGAFTAVHVTVVRVRRDHHFGILAGYPIAGGADDPAQVLLGLGYRFTGGVGVGFGGHLYRNQVMKDGYPNEVDLGLPGNAALTADSVSTSDPGIAPFLTLGVSTDLLTD